MIAWDNLDAEIEGIGRRSMIRSWPDVGMRCRQLSKAAKKKAETDLLGSLSLDEAATPRNGDVRFYPILQLMTRLRNPYLDMNMHSKARMHDHSTEPLRTFAEAET